MLKRLLKLLEDEEDHNNPVEETIKELENAISTLASRLSQVNETSHTYQTKLANYKAEHKTNLQKAQEHYMKNRESQALTAFKKVKLLEEQINQYEALVLSVETTRNQLFSRKNECELKMDQLTAQLKLGEINADTSKIRAEIMEHMMLLEQSGEISKYDHSIAEAESKYEAIQEMTSLPPDPTSDGDSELKDLDIELKAMHREASNESLAKAKKKYSNFFEETTSSESIADQKALLLKQLKETVDSSEDKVKSFFKSKDESSEKKDRIKDFFGE